MNQKQRKEEMMSFVLVVILLALIDINESFSLNSNMIKKCLSCSAGILLTTMPVNAKVIGEIGTSGLVFKGYIF